MTQFIDMIKLKEKRDQDSLLWDWVYLCTVHSNRIEFCDCSVRVYFPTLLNNNGYYICLNRIVVRIVINGLHFESVETSQVNYSLLILSTKIISYILTLISDQDIISPYNIDTISSWQVRRMKKI